MLSATEDRLRDLNPQATLKAHGQKLNARTYAICRSDMMIKGEDADNIATDTPSPSVRGRSAA